MPLPENHKNDTSWQIFLKSQDPWIAKLRNEKDASKNKNEDPYSKFNTTDLAKYFLAALSP